MQFGSKQSSPQLKDGTISSGKFDGADDVFIAQNSSSSGSSTNGSPVVFGSLQRAYGQPQQKQYGPADPNSYFQQASRMVAVGASPTVSPLGNTIIHGDNSGTSRSTTSVLGQSSGHAVPPQSMVGGFQPFTGTSPHEFASYDMHGRFPFFGADAHAATAIRGN